MCEVADKMSQNTTQKNPSTITGGHGGSGGGGGHHLAVYAVRWNPFHPRLFLSCGADWTVKARDGVWCACLPAVDINTAVYRYEADYSHR